MVNAVAADIVTADIFGDFRKLMMGEIGIRPEHSSTQAYFGCEDVLELAREFYSMAMRILEIAKSSTVPRSYNLNYNLCKDDFIYESVGGHANLVAAIATEALDFYYGYEFGGKRFGQYNETIDGYSYRDIMEVIRLHDLAENETGDQADNGNRDEEKKQQQELEFLDRYLAGFPIEQEALKAKISCLFRAMQTQSLPTGELLFLADKVAALLITLTLDFLGHPPLIMEDSSYASERDRLEMAMCDYNCGGAYKASEMWAIDFFEIRHIVDMDKKFFFTALIVMTTLIVNGRWYSWRETNYY